MALSDAEQKELLDLARNLNGRLSDGGSLGNAILSVWKQVFYGSPTYGPALVTATDTARFAKAIAAALPSGTAVTQDQLEAALRKVLGSVDEVGK